MNKPNELGMMICLEIVKYLRQDEMADKSNPELEFEEILEVVKHLPPGVMLGALFGNQYIDAKQEVSMGDTYDVSGQAGAVGPEAHAHDMTFQQVWTARASELELPQLAKELETLRVELRSRGQTREHDLAIAEVGAAAEAAETGDGPKSLLHLSRAGRWALGVATSIGAAVAAGAIKAALGI